MEWPLACPMERLFEWALEPFEWLLERPLLPCPLAAVEIVCELQKALTGVGWCTCTAKSLTPVGVERDSVDEPGTAASSEAYGYMFCLRTPLMVCGMNGCACEWSLSGARGVDLWLNEVERVGRVERGGRHCLSAFDENIKLRVLTEGSSSSPRLSSSSIPYTRSLSW